MADKPLVWMHGEVKSPPFSKDARMEAGGLLGRLQRGEKLPMPVSRPMPNIGPNCHELRIVDADMTWRIAYYVAKEAIVILDVFEKKTRATPKHVIKTAQRRMRLYRATAEQGD